MAQYTLTQAQQDALKEALESAEKEQDAVINVYQPNLTAGEARRDAAYAKVESGMSAIGETTGAVTELHMERVLNEGTGEMEWTGKVFVNEALS